MYTQMVEQSQGGCVSSPFSTFCTGLKICPNSSVCVGGFLAAFSASLASSSFLAEGFPPKCTCFCTCWMNFCCLAPFLFFSPNVLSCQDTRIRGLQKTQPLLLRSGAAPQRVRVENRETVQLKNLVRKYKSKSRTSTILSFFFCSVFLLGAACAGAFFGGIA